MLIQKCTFPKKLGTSRQKIGNEFKQRINQIISSDKGTKSFYVCLEESETFKKVIRITLSKAELKKFLKD